MLPLHGQKLEILKDYWPDLHMCVGNIKVLLNYLLRYHSFFQIVILVVVKSAIIDVYKKAGIRKDINFEWGKFIGKFFLLFPTAYTYVSFVQIHIKTLSTTNAGII